MSSKNGDTPVWDDTKRHVGLLVATILAAGGCRDDAGEPLPQQQVAYSVTFGFAQPDLDVFVDGLELAPTNPPPPQAASYYFSTIFATHGEAESSAPVHVETWIRGQVVDQIDVGFGACQAFCISDPDAACSGLDVVSEAVDASFDENGFFVGASDGPRSWRSVGCMRCAFTEQAADFVICV